MQNTKLDNLYGIMTKDYYGFSDIEGERPWHLPYDMTFFRRTIEGNVVIITREASFNTTKYLDNASMILELGTNIIEYENILDFIKGNPDKKFFICGGMEAYTYLEPFISKWYITEVDNEGKERVSSTTYSPELEDYNVKEVWSQPKGKGNEFGFTINKYFYEEENS